MIYCRKQYDFYFVKHFMVWQWFFVTFLHILITGSSLVFHIYSIYIPYMTRIYSILI